MAVVIRMQRVGTRNRPFWHIVAADSRMKRDGRFLEKLGHYDPVPNPQVIQLDLEKVDSWVKKGAKPSVKVASLMRLVARGGPIATVTEPKVAPVVEAKIPEAEAPIEAKTQAEVTEPTPEAAEVTPAVEEEKPAE
ncbi:MAG: 30S ribosomal protein S16 [Candidatus Eisenbacteria bacterium]|uniref:Small ribosomal subunit protein bS16 n=1 Tax=Eiseniibacteriota bacterium TaxID=2212470 RepID=A0A948RYB7_UNCEI|nr:30S ribosomal protein S16 [Candidatus Eisenbacteria bacterium]MBU1950106.1 30S ribosomal protein S16 [Candidatus Eisenbacteria bacterium]MBU2691332.1 30S ribosomal protein S16 [Candidatus Eisenbacteria bacterium]